MDNKELSMMSINEQMSWMETKLKILSESLRVIELKRLSESLRVIELLISDEDEEEKRRPRKPSCICTCNKRS